MTRTQLSWKVMAAERPARKSFEYFGWEVYDLDPGLGRGDGDQDADVGNVIGKGKHEAF